MEAQVSGATVASYSWSFTNAPDATNITGANTYAVQFAWSSTASNARNDTISVTETPAGGGNPITQNYLFQITGTSSPAWSNPPTSAGTWELALGQPAAVCSEEGQRHLPHPPRRAVPPIRSSSVEAQGAALP